MSGLQPIPSKRGTRGFAPALERVGRRVCNLLSALWAQAHPRRTKQLRLCESLSLGERRFVAVVQFEQQRFLLGGSANSVTLLAQLSPPAGCLRTAGERPAHGEAA